MQRINLKNIFKCIICDNYFLCEKCYKINNKNKNKFHSHVDFFCIYFPTEVIKQIQEEIKLNNNIDKTIDKFNKLLQEYFFDIYLKLLLEEKKQIDSNKLKSICKDMKVYSNDQIEYFAYYQLFFLEKPKKELKDKQKNLFDKKI